MGMYYKIMNSSGWSGQDYDVYYGCWDKKHNVKFIETYITKKSMSKKKFANDNDLNYKELLKYLNDDTFYGHIEWGISSFISCEIADKEIQKNKKILNAELSNYDIEIAKLFLNQLINNNRRVVIGGSNITTRYEKVMKYLSEMGLSVKITNVYNPRCGSDHDHTITFELTEQVENSTIRILGALNKVKLEL